MFWSATGGGVQRYLRAKHDWLASQPQVRHRIVAPLGRSDALRTTGGIDCGGWPIPRSGGYRYPADRRALARLLCAAEPDVIEAADPYGLAWAALDAGQQRGVPVVAFCHSDLPRLAAGWLGSRGWAAHAAERAASAYLRRLYRHFDRVLAPSRAMTQALIALGLPQARHQPLGVDTALFHPARTDPQWRTRAGLAPDARLLLYTGRLAPEKHLDVLVAAVERLGPPYLLLLVGDGPSAPAPTARVQHWPHVHDPLELARIVANADLFVHAGDQETFGLSALEAMACGTPVMVRAAAGLAELVACDTGEGAGVGLPDNRPDTWAEAISAWFSTRDHRPTGPQAQTADRALALARAHDWRVLLPPWLAQMQHLAQRPDAPTPRPAAGLEPMSLTKQP